MICHGDFRLCSACHIDEDYHTGAFQLVWEEGEEGANQVAIHIVKQKSDACMHLDILVNVAVACTTAVLLTIISVKCCGIDVQCNQAYMTAIAQLTMQTDPAKCLYGHR